jgi:hypothetical protein
VNVGSLIISSLSLTFFKQAVCILNLVQILLIFTAHLEISSAQELLLAVSGIVRSGDHCILGSTCTILFLGMAPKFSSDFIDFTFQISSIPGDELLYVKTGIATTSIKALWCNPMGIMDG